MNFAPVLDRDHKLFSKAMIAAFLSSYSTKVGCVAAKGNKVLGAVANKQRNSVPSNPEYWKILSHHAEYVCLDLLSKQEYGKVTFYIARLNRMGEVMPSRPCSRCMEDITTCGIKHIVYLDKHFNLVKEVL